MPVGKPELVEAVASAVEISKSQGKEALEALLDAVTSALKKGEKVQLVGFGTFGVRKRAARMAKNPRTGEAVRVPAAKVPYFKPGAALKDAVKK